MGGHATHGVAVELASRADGEKTRADRPVAVTQLTQVTAVEPLEPYRLRLWFSDGSVHEVDVERALAQGGVFAPVYADHEVFRRVRVSGGTVEWPGGVDLDPLVLHGEYQPSNGEPYPRRIVRGPEESQPA